MLGRTGEGVTLGSVVLDVLDLFRARRPVGLFVMLDAENWRTGHSQDWKSACGVEATGQDEGKPLADKLTSVNLSQAPHTGFPRSQAFFLLRQAAHPSLDRVITGRGLTWMRDMASGLEVSTVKATAEGDAAGSGGEEL